MPKLNLDAWQIDLAVELYEVKGSFYPEIAKILDISVSSVRKVLIDAGVKVGKDRVFSDCRECGQKLTRCPDTGHMIQCKLCKKKRVAEWLKENPSYQRDYYGSSEGKKKMCAYSKKSRSKPHNRAKIRARNAERRAAKLCATPLWADKKKIEAFYETAQGLSMLLGEWYHVDHIVPLSSNLVCGLHCDANLQVCLGTDNIIKGNRWWPDMPDYERGDYCE